MATRMTGGMRGWWGRFRDDLKASTDASLLGLLRFLGLLYGPIDTSLPIDQAFRKALRNRVSRMPAGGRRSAGITYLLFLILVVTGVLLSFYYRPSAEEAYQSMQHIVSGVRFGWLMRDLHVWGANLVVLAALAHMARVFFGSAYKPPRETNWLLGVLLLFMIFAFGATGYLLPWDQGAYWTASNGLGMVSRIPLLGGSAAEILRGDPIVSGATLSRFFALHVIVLPWIALGLLVLHFTLVRKHGVAPPPGAAPDLPGAIREGPPFYPHIALRSMTAGVLVVAIIITCAVLFPRETGAPANPCGTPGVPAVHLDRRGRLPGADPLPRFLGARAVRAAGLRPDPAAPVRPHARTGPAPAARGGRPRPRVLPRLRARLGGGVPAPHRAGLAERPAGSRRRPGANGSRHLPPSLSPTAPPMPGADSQTTAPDSLNRGGRQ